jgi:hypothetical protein
MRTALIVVLTLLLIALLPMWPTPSQCNPEDASPAALAE